MSLGFPNSHINRNVTIYEFNIKFATNVIENGQICDTRKHTHMYIYISIYILSKAYKLFIQVKFHRWNSFCRYRLLIKDYRIW